MIFEELSSRLQEKLEFAAQQMVNVGDKQPIADLISKMQLESFRDGYNSAVQTLQNN